VVRIASRRKRENLKSIIDNETDTSEGQVYLSPDFEYKLVFDPSLSLDPLWVDFPTLEMINALRADMPHSTK
jgi:hypothetical protein